MATCKNCNNNNVTWLRSQRGSWYLVNGDGSNNKDFHSKTCGNVPAQPAEPMKPKCDGMVTCQHCGICTDCNPDHVCKYNPASDITDPTEQLIAANRDVLVASLNGLLRQPDSETRAAVAMEHNPPKQPIVVSSQPQAAQSTRGRKRATFKCTTNGCIVDSFDAELVPRKCHECGKSMVIAKVL